MDRRRFLAALGTVTAVGTAGCTDSGTDRPFADAEWREGDELALDTLAESHVETLVDAGGVTLFSTAETSHDGDEEPAPWLPTQEYESGYDLTNGRWYVRQELTQTEETDVSELYIAEGEALIRQVIGEETQYDRQSVDRSADRLTEAMRSEALTGIRVEGETANGAAEYEGLNRWNMASDGGSEVRGDRTARFTADAFDGDRTIPESIETASATLHVFESGVVPRLEQSWEGKHDGRTATVDVGIDYRDPGAEIPEPDWAADARNARDTANK
ncbi:hypothetical protein [Halorubrum trueperi]|uniref:Tat (Twin-arginine translocation) pathway signal sequence n=1 Tax=Halorubrum trueperi TaxID=2004704 RepID=A0ABD5UIA0_9EURY